MIGLVTESDQNQGMQCKRQTQLLWI